MPDQGLHPDAPRPVVRLRIDIDLDEARWLLDRKHFIEVVREVGGGTETDWAYPLAIDVLPPSRHLWGEPAGDWAFLQSFDSECVGLLRCADCGFAECSAVIAELAVSDSFVTWHSFRFASAGKVWGPPRFPGLKDLPPIHFGRLQYERAIQDAAK